MCQTIHKWTHPCSCRGTGFSSLRQEGSSGCTGRPLGKQSTQNGGGHSQMRVSLTGWLLEPTRVPLAPALCQAQIGSMGPGHLCITDYASWETANDLRSCAAASVVHYLRFLILALRGWLAGWIGTAGWLAHYASHAAATVHVHAHGACSAQAMHVRCPPRSIWRGNSGHFCT